MSVTGSEKTEFSFFRGESVAEVTESAFHATNAPVMVRLIIFFGIVSVATGMWVCSHGPTPFQVCGRSIRYSIPGKMMMFAGSMLSITGLVAVIEARSLSRIAITSLVHILCIVLILESVAGSTAVALSSSIVNGFLNTSLSEDLRMDYSRSKHVTLYWDRLQQTLGCCGVRGPRDWQRSLWHDTTTFNISQPFSCCRTGRFCDDSDIYTKGCGDESSRELHGSLVRLYTCAFSGVLVHTSCYLMLVFLQTKV